MNRTEAVNIGCPYCGETIEISVDCSVENQSYIEDCQVCCRPIDITVAIDEAGIPSVEVSQEDDV
ncbi:MAG TPA: CPXCG motif-containing cysteine-rich protein [Gammaproteobacteria bacterium]|nr:CPXCG motif-containing cysteine-rich protein [Gammaproteobacteria bacterium]